MDLEELVEDFEFFDAWEDRYRYLMDLGKKLPPMDPVHKIEANRVRGCTSMVWVVPRAVDHRLQFDADSDSAIVKGLVAIAYALFFDRSREEVAAIDVEEVFKRLGLDTHLSANRRNGFQSLVQKLKRAAESL